MVPWNDKEQTWADRLEQNDIFAASIGKMDVAGPCTSVGFKHFDEIEPRNEYSSYPLEDIKLPIDFELPNEKLPPALYHYQKTRNFFNEIRGQEHMRRIMACYYGMISCMDYHIGQVLDELERQGLMDNTYIIYTSDYGEAMGEHGMFNKLSPFEASSKIPLIISGPDMPKGDKNNDLVSLIDLHPTVLDMMNIEQNPKEQAELQGASWLPLVKDEKHKRLDYVFSEYEGMFFVNKWFMIVKGNYKYVYYEGNAMSFHNLKDDPNEMIDLSDNPEYKNVIDELRDILFSICAPEEAAKCAKQELGFKYDSE